MIQGVTNGSLKDLELSNSNPFMKINHYLYNKYSKKDFSYNHICIDNLICNENCHIVARFKDFLIYDDNSEFLSEFFTKNNLKSKLKNIFEFYSTYIKIYPNYLVIPENKFIYKNLRKKQKVINKKNAKKIKNEENKIYSKSSITCKNSNYIENSLEKKFAIDKSDISNNSINKNIKSNFYDKKYLSSKSHSKMKQSKLINLSNNSNNNLTERIYDKKNRKNNLNENKENINNQNTQYSSISNMNFNGESNKSKTSITELINLLSPSENNKTLEKKEKYKLEKCGYKLTKINKKRIKFFRLSNSDYIKKVFKTHKIKSNFFMSGIEKINTKKNESKNNNKKCYFKNNKKIINSNKLHKQTISYIENISKILKEKSKNKHAKNQSNSSKFRNNNNYNQCLVLKTLNKLSKKNKISNIKNNINNNTIKDIFMKKHNKLKNRNNFILSTNSTINFDNNISNIYKLNEVLRTKTNYQNFNTTKDLMKNNIHFKLMKSINTLVHSNDEQKSQIKYKKEKETEKLFNKNIKLDSDSILSTQVSLKKKFRHNSTCTEDILSKVKNSLLKKKLNKFNKNNNTNILSFSKQYTNFVRNRQLELNENINSYSIKPFSPYFHKISTYTNKNAKSKEKNSTLKKNKKIFNFFDSKDFYNLRIKSIKNKKIKNSGTNKNISLIRSNDTSKVNKSVSLNLKSFNKGFFNIKNSEINTNKNKNLKMCYRNKHFETIRKDKYFYDHISTDKFENNKYFITKHKKSNTTNNYKIMEEISKKIEKTSKLKIKVNAQNTKQLLNRLKNNKNFIQYKISSKVLTKSLKIKNNNETNNNFIKN